MHNTKLSGLILGVALALAASGCTVRGSGRFVATGPGLVITEAPPPPRVIVVPAARPGFIWVDARWERRNNQWAWNDGRWEQQRVGQSWREGRWTRRNHGHVWIEGSWQGGGRDTIEVRDHRR